MKSLLLCFALTAAQALLPDMTGITNALRSGDAEALSAFLADEVELAILTEEDAYSKAEAKALLKGFFAKHSTKSFSQVHKGTSKGEDSHYVIGDLEAGGKTFRIYIYLEVVGDQYRIVELRIEE